MSDIIFLAFDNGVSGSIAGISNDGRVVYYSNTPIQKCLNYTKTKQSLNRLDGPYLSAKMNQMMENFFGLQLPSAVHCFIERPMVNPGRFKATMSAVRCLEATLVVMEHLQIPYEFCDSKEWQRVLLPKGLQKEELKFASDEVCKRLFPSIKLSESGRGDSLLIAEFARRRHNGQI